MLQEKLTDDLRNLIQTIPSIPYLEAILLMKGPPVQPWATEAVGTRLYLANDQAAIILGKLCNSRICVAVPNKPNHYVYQPATPELDELIGKLINFYAYNLIEVTNLIHANASQKNVQQYADAFKWRGAD